LVDFCSYCRNHLEDDLDSETIEGLTIKVVEQSKELDCGEPLGLHRFDCQDHSAARGVGFRG
jgi:hypothetical protein